MQEQILQCRDLASKALANLTFTSSNLVNIIKNERWEVLIYFKRDLILVIFSNPQTYLSSSSSFSSPPMNFSLNLTLSNHFSFNLFAISFQVNFCNQLE